MPQLNPGERRFLNLDAGKVLTVTCDSISSAIVRAYPINGGESTGQSAVAANGSLTRGPYASAATRWCIESAGAGVSYSVDISTVADVVLDASGNAAANGATVSGYGNSKVLAAFGGSTTTPVSPAVGGTGNLTGSYGLPVPWVKIPANTLPSGGAVLEISALVKRTGTLANIALAARLGPTKGQFDPHLGLPSVSNNSSTNAAIVTWRVAIADTTAAVLFAGNVTSNGAIQQATAVTEIALDRTVDNYVTFDCTGVNARATAAVIGAGKGGTGYTVGDVLTVQGGTGTAATLTVTTVSGGAITFLAVTTAGNYSAVPTNYTGDVTVTGGTGTGATPTLTWAMDQLALLGGEVVLHQPPAQATRTSLTSGPISVPSTFFGFNSQVWPVSGTAPTLNFGTFCTFGTKKLHWCNLQTASNALSANIGDFDTAVNSMKAAGRKINFTFYGTPTAFASTGSGTPGAWGDNGEGAYPNDLTQVTYFLTQIINRANGLQDGIITSIQLWNEPDFTATPGNASFWGTRPQFVDLLWTAYAAIKAADPRIVVLCPGTFDLTNANYGLNQWINQTGTVNSTKRGYDCFDAIASHPYHARPLGPLYSGFGDIWGLSLGGILPFRQSLKTYGKGNVDFYITEYGIASGYDQELQWFLNSTTAAYRKAFISRLLVDCMLAGVKVFGAFGFGPSQAPLMGDLTNDTTGVVAGWNETYAACAGKTIVDGGFVSDGSRYLTFSDGTSYTV